MRFKISSKWNITFGWERSSHYGRGTRKRESEEEQLRERKRKRESVRQKFRQIEKETESAKTDR